MSLAGHLALLAAWMSTLRDLGLAEAPALQVQLVRPPPKPPPPAPRKLPPAATRTSRPALRTHPPPLASAASAPAPLEMSSGSGARPTGLPGVDLDAAPFVLGRAGLRRARAARPDCKAHGWSRPANCKPDATELLASRFDAARDSRTGDFAAQGAGKLKMKSYRESSSMADFPGIACSILNKC